MRGLIALLKRYARNLDENPISLENATADVLRQNPYKARNSRVASRVPDYFVTLLTFSPFAYGVGRGNGVGRGLGVGGGRVAEGVGVAGGVVAVL